MKINRLSKKSNMKFRLLAVIGILAMLMGLAPNTVLAAPAAAQVVVPIPGPAPDVNIVTVNDGAGGQTDPHASGDWVSYTDYSVYGVRFQNLDLGAVSDRLIPHLDGEYDYLSDISGNKLVFLRETSGYQRIYLVQIDPLGNPSPAVEVSPVAVALRGRATVGDDTIAYEDRSYDGSLEAPAEISLSSVSDPAAPAYRLTDDTVVDQSPAVSPDGNAVVWLKGPYGAWDVWRAERTEGIWGSPEQVTGADGNESLPDTNGPVTVYGSTAGGDNNIRWSVKDSSGAYVESVLDLPGTQRNPNISGNLITFESSTAAGTQFDIWLYDLAMNRLYQLTDTPISETLTDISTGPGGLVRVTWAQPKQVYPYDMDVYALSFLLPDIDATAPLITPTISGTQGANGWYTSDVSLTWSVSDPESEISSTNGCEDVSITQDQAATGYTCDATSSGGSASLTVSIARDATKPVSTVTGVAEGATYELGSVPQAGCASTDDQSGMATEATLTLSGGDEQGAGIITATCSGAQDAAGNNADPASVHYTVVLPDNHAPVAVDDSYSTIANTPLEISPAGVLGNDTDANEGEPLTAALVDGPAHGTLLLNADGSFTYTPSTNYAGPDRFTYKANDGQDDSNVATVSIAIQYSFTGFFQPVDNLPTENVAKAGSAIPVKFSLGGDLSLNILSAGSPTSKQVACPGGTVTVDAIDQTDTANSGLTYDETSGQYTYVWKTNKTWANSCRMFTILFVDGSTQQALFKFKK